MPVQRWYSILRTEPNSGMYSSHLLAKFITILKRRVTKEETSFFSVVRRGYQPVRLYDIISHTDMDSCDWAIFYQVLVRQQGMIF